MTNACAATGDVPDALNPTHLKNVLDISIELCKLHRKKFKKGIIFGPKTASTCTFFDFNML